MIADLDTLLIALYVELTDRIIPSLGLARTGPGKPPAVTSAELVCLAVAQVLLRYDNERHWLRAAAARVGKAVYDNTSSYTSAPRSHNRATCSARLAPRGTTTPLPP